MSSPYDLVGPVLPQALRLARYQASVTLPQNIDDLQGENDTINQTPSREEERLLVSNASVMTALENLFSWSTKDRTCRTSTLSHIESVRFQRAMYRLWLMSVLFGPRRFMLTRSYDELIQNRELELEKSWEDQKTFLEQFPSQELLQIRKLAWFLLLTATWAVIAEGREPNYAYEWDGMYLFAGPHIILRCYEDATMSHLPMDYLDDDGPYTKFLEHPITQIFRERQVTEPFNGYVGVILDDIHGLHDRCTISGFLNQLYTNLTHWDVLKTKLDRGYIYARNLLCNLVEGKPLSQALGGDWSKLVNEMFACRSDEYAKWSKGDWVCSHCWSSFFRDTLWRWRLAQKQKAGEHIGENCRCGYNCEGQRFKVGLAHAKQFNHLCEPIEKATPVCAF
ncbi:hypothetical protein L210DRAFT_3550884 [Boletus edulis BED1]|uniref:Uncharacterized protein n=1 Tax=Boletus edulis BED1 TaxID=1328754 RepID=A0AAD4BNR8_BOLED|nr:hypothetical protein L210DRAFT_3550884 [Boletus edulis BED1]